MSKLFLITYYLVSTFFIYTILLGYDTDSWGNIDRQPSTTFKPVLIDDRSEPARAKIKPKRWNSDFEKFKTRLFQEKPRDTPVRKPLLYDRTRPRIENQFQESSFPYDPISPIPKPAKPSQRKRINKINRVKDANSDEILEDQKSFNVRPLGNRRMSRPPTRSERPIQPRFETSSQFSQPRPNTPRFIRPFTDRNFDINVTKWFESKKTFGKSYFLVNLWNHFIFSIRLLRGQGQY